MVEIVEEPEDSSQGASSSSQSHQHENQRATYTSVSQYVSANTMDCVLFGARFLTVFFCLNYMFPFLGIVHWYSAYYKVFAASAATFALRLHTRVQGRISVSREFLMQLTLEDAFHYLIYSVVFLMASPVTMATLPVTLYALLQASSFLVKALRETGRNYPFVSKLEQINQQQTQNSLGIIACSEIFLVPLLVSLVFSGQGSMMLPFVYYRFLTLRYASRRNPSTRQAFFQMRISLENVAQSSMCPQVVRMLIHKSIAFLSSRAPPVM
ncbi:unnamed protein product [Caenorhabditis angaria]|uniref:Transmembrane protein 33 n=1 Tax=Caenorhabditis angaria TaxID=860376 RepID=A0A9P1IMQ3_9PELO|nr:unnamed protein product [Caenorhabditis angaria]